MAAIQIGRPWSIATTRPGRALSHRAKEYLGEYKGYIQTDGYSGYQALGESDGIIHVGCMAHIRRKFMDVQKATSKKITHGTAKEILDLIGLLYKVEHNIKELEPEEKVPMRLSKQFPSSTQYGPSSTSASTTSRPKACSDRP